MTRGVATGTPARSGTAGFTAHSCTISHVPLLIHGDLQIEKLLSIFTFPFSSPSNKNKQGLLTYVVVGSHKIKGKKGNLCMLDGLFCVTEVLVYILNMIHGKLEP